MELMNLLETGIPIYQQTFGVSLNWIGNLIRLLISGVGIVGVGIILFSLILKMITMPFDIYQRISMRKQNNKMKENQEKMEKLKKQYANDEKLYNQKVAEMYRESGMSLFSSCLPMILSMVIFIVAINAFNDYSQYANVKNYNTMVNAYNTELQQYAADLTTENIGYELTEDGSTVIYTVADKNADSDKYFYYRTSYAVPQNENGEYVYEYNADEAISYIGGAKKDYYIDIEKAKTNAEVQSAIESKAEDVDEIDAIYNYFVGKAQDAVVEEYNTTIKKGTSFLWIKNIWATDASYKHPVMKYSDFYSELTASSGCSCSGSVPDHFREGAYSEDAYNTITAKLSAQKKQANGYYILIILSIGTILLQQFVMMRSQKDQQKFATVDGQGAGQQKIMMIVMTAMFAIFSFMYSSAFSIYMITSNLFSMISTLVINKFVDLAASKKENAATVRSFHNHSAERIEAAKQAGKASASRKNRKK
jgi:membrane protein insertase Oxa1/YidC/SpoIIIJ